MIDKVIITEFIYIIFTYLNLEIINYFESATKNVKIDISTPSPTTI